MSVTLLDALSNDANRIAEILISSRKHYLPYAPSPHSEQDVKRWVGQHLIPGGGVTLAVDGREIVGVLATTEADGFGWIDQMYLTPERVGQGIGSMLIAHAMKVLPKPIRLYCFQENQWARQFYERHGFRAISFTDGADNEECCPDVLYELPS